jgi:hypothetical protein
MNLMILGFSSIYSHVMSLDGASEIRCRLSSRTPGATAAVAMGNIPNLNTECLFETRHSQSMSTLQCINTRDGARRATEVKEREFQW